MRITARASTAPSTTTTNRATTIPTSDHLTMPHPRCNVHCPVPDIKNMSALVVAIVILNLLAGVVLVQGGKLAITAYYQSAYRYQRLGRNIGRVRR